MSRHACLLLALWSSDIMAQPMAGGTGAALAFGHSIALPMNAVHLHDAAAEAWTWTFGKEPGARLAATDRAEGILRGSARINFRSAMLTGREETTGTISYQVHIQVKAGECRITVNDLVHTGNRDTYRGGIHLNRLMRNDADAHKPGGMGRANIERLHGELRLLATERIHAVMQAFEARLRAGLDP